MRSAKTTASFGLFLLLAAIGGGCGSNSPPEAADRKPSAIDRAVTIEKAAIPSRYSAALPASVAGLRSWLDGDPAIAPVPHVAESIMDGDAAWLARLKAAAGAVPAAEQRAWARMWHALFEFESADPAFCAQTRAIMSGPPAAVRAAISGVFARSCAKPEDAPAVLRADTPYWAVLEYFDPWSGGDAERRRPFDPRLVAAAREAILEHGGLEARSAAFTLAEQHDPRADAALLAIHAEIRDQERADEVAMAFADARNGDAIERAAEACARRPDDPACSADAPLPSGQPTADEARVPTAAVKARVAQLGALGFGKVGTVNVAEIDADAAEVILVAAGHAHWFDVETGMYPNQHDSLMRSLARLVSPALDGAVFEERPPAVDDGSGPYQLLAYVGGKLYRTEAENLDDWYDVDAVLRLMNAILEDRNAGARFTGLASTDQTMIVVGAPREAIEKAVRDGLLELGDPREAERIGKAFEERVLRSLQN